MLLSSANVSGIVVHALSLKHESIAAITEATSETALDPDDGVDRHLGRSAFVVSALPIGWFPRHSELR